MGEACGKTHSVTTFGNVQINGTFAKRINKLIGIMAWGCCVIIGVTCQRVSNRTTQVVCMVKLVLCQEDVPGVSLAGRDPKDLKVPELK